MIHALHFVAVNSIALSQATSYGSSQLPLLSISSDLALQLLSPKTGGLEELADTLDRSPQVHPTPNLDDITLSANVDLVYGQGKGRNVLGKLQVGPEPSPQVIMLGAHVDHLGRGQGGNSLAKGDEVNQIHAGADDNASGVSALIEIAAPPRASPSLGRTAPEKARWR